MTPLVRRVLALFVVLVSIGGFLLFAIFNVQTAPIPSVVVSPALSPVIIVTPSRTHVHPNTFPASAWQEYRIAHGEKLVAYARPEPLIAPAAIWLHYRWLMGIRYAGVHHGSRAHGYTKYGFRCGDILISRAVVKITRYASCLP